MSRTHLVTLLCLLAACASVDSAGYSSPPPAPPPPPGGGNPPPTSASVAMTSSDDGYGTAQHRFAPSSVTVARNGTVTWRNESGFTHNVTFTPRTGVPTNIADMATGSASRTFTATGTFSYRCTNHTGMQGEVVIQ